MSSEIIEGLRLDFYKAFLFKTELQDQVIQQPTLGPERVIMQASSNVI